MAIPALVATRYRSTVVPRWRTRCRSGRQYVHVSCESKSTRNVHCACVLIRCQGAR